MDEMTATLLAIGLVFVLLATGVPVFASLALAGVAGVSQLRGAAAPPTRRPHAPPPRRLLDVWLEATSRPAPPLWLAFADGGTSLASLLYTADTSGQARVHKPSVRRARASPPAGWPAPGRSRAPGPRRARGWRSAAPTTGCRCGSRCCGRCCRRPRACTRAAWFTVISSRTTWCSWPPREAAATTGTSGARWTGCGAPPA